MELSFDTPEIREICEVREAATAALGDGRARDLAARLAEVEASDSFSELELLLGDQLELQHDDTYVLVLATGTAIKLCVGGATIPKTAGGGVDWGSVTRVRIVSIEPLV